ncbi:hypothetical protein [Aminobacter phage Erebus]|nr:hypothetical protein [Aminobacter phage Erebus]
MIDLRKICVNKVAREIARPRVQHNEGWRAWPAKTREAIPEAEEKINAMTNLELLDVIAEALNEM